MSPTNRDPRFGGFEHTLAVARRTKTSHSHPEFDVGYDAGYASVLGELEQWAKALGGGPTLQARYRTALEKIVALQDADDQGYGPEYWAGIHEAAAIAEAAIESKP